METGPNEGDYVQTFINPSSEAVDILYAIKPYSNNLIPFFLDPFGTAAVANITEPCFQYDYTASHAIDTALFVADATDDLQLVPASGSECQKKIQCQASGPSTSIAGNRLTVHFKALDTSLCTSGG